MRETTPERCDARTWQAPYFSSYNLCLQDVTPSGLMFSWSCTHANLPVTEARLRSEGNPRGTILPLTGLCIPSENLHVGNEERDMYSVEL